MPHQVRGVMVGGDGAGSDRITVGGERMGAQQSYGQDNDDGGR